MMEQDVLIDALGKQLDGLESILNWVVVITIAVLWAGIQRQTQLEIGSFKVASKQVFYVAVAAYLYANITILFLFSRVGDILLLLDKDHAVEGVTTLTTHQWLLNPYSYFGASSINGWHQNIGYGLLIIIWWVANTSLTIWQENKWHAGLLVLFFGTGLLSMSAIRRVYGITFNLVEDVNSELFGSLLLAFGERQDSTLIGIGIGGAIFFVVSSLRSRPQQNPPPESQTQ